MNHYRFIKNTYWASTHIILQEISLLLCRLLGESTPVNLQITWVDLVYIFRHYVQWTQLLWLSVCCSAHQVPSENRFTLKEKNSVPRGAFFFPFRVELISKGRQIILKGLFPMKIEIHLNYWGINNNEKHFKCVLIWHRKSFVGLGGSVGCAVRLETRRSRVQPPPRSATFFRGDWSWNIFYGHSLPSADSRRAVVSFWRKNVHNTG